jgi:hypothetical protein
VKQPRPPDVEIIRLGKITSYEVLESDRQRIADGPPESIYLAFEFACLSTAVTLFATLQSTTIQPDRLDYTFVIVASTTFVGSLILFVIWWPTRGYYKKLVQEIKGRMPSPQGIPAEAPPPPAT